VGRAFASFCHADGSAPKYIDLPLANYATLPYDTVSSHGRMVGISTYTGYTYNERAMVSLAIVDADVGMPGTEVTVLWGEPGGGTSKPTVERHTQMEIRATVAPAPLSQVAREAYRPPSRS
jgi:glycine cleavage system aminomethyltransferase T